VNFDHPARPVGLRAAAVDQHGHQPAPSRAKAARAPPIDALEGRRGALRGRPSARSQIDEAHLGESIGQARHFESRVVIGNDDFESGGSNLLRKRLEAACQSGVSLHDSHDDREFRILNGVRESHNNHPSRVCCPRPAVQSCVTAPVYAILPVRLEIQS